MNTKKIILKPRGKEFKNLPIGTMFTSGGHLYIKIQDVYRVCDADIGIHSCMNAVLIEDGGLYQFSLDYLVTPISCEINEL